MPAGGGPPGGAAGGARHGAVRQADRCRAASDRHAGPGTRPGRRRGACPPAAQRVVRPRTGRLRRSWRARTASSRRTPRWPSSGASRSGWSRTACALDDPAIDELLDRVARDGRDGEPLLLRIARRARSAGHRRLGRWCSAGRPHSPRSSRCARPSRAPARRGPRCATAPGRLVLATAHGTKGLEFDHVAVVGMDEGVFPSDRSITEAPIRRAPWTRSGAWPTSRGRAPARSCCWSTIRTRRRYSCARRSPGAESADRPRAG